MPSVSPSGRHVPDRPPFMELLGLLPPYSREDVETAYTELKNSMQRTGVDGEAISAVREAYDDAVGFLQLHESRRQWLGQHVARYTERIAFTDAVADVGGRCTRHAPDRYVWTYGDDFAEIMRPILAIVLVGRSIDDATLSLLDQYPEVAREIWSLDLRNSQVTDAGLAAVARCRQLRCLHLGGTSVSGKGLALLDSLTSLEWLHVGETGIGRFARGRLARSRPQLTIALDPGDELPQVGERSYEHARLVDRIAQLNRNS